MSRSAAGFPASGVFRPAAWLLSAQLLLATWADADLWGHLRFGLDLLRDHRLSSVDPYSFTQDLPWINHEWLSELVMAAAYALGGNVGLMALRALFAGTALLLLAGAVRHADDRWRWPVLALGAAAMIPMAGTVRPQLWTLVFVLALCRILQKGDAWLFVLPPLFAVWANAHGGWIVGLGMLLAWLAGDTVEAFVSRVGAGRRGAARLPTTLAFVAIVSVLATLVTPYGWHLWRFMLETVRLARTDITEWQPIWRAGAATPMLWGCGVALVMAAVRRHRPPVRIALVIAMLAYASFQVTRLVPLFVVASATLLASGFPLKVNPPVTSSGRTVADAAAAAGAVLLMVWTGVLPWCIAITGAWSPDLVAAAALREAQPQGRIVTYFDWGQYAIWHFGPALRVSIDGRRETIYSPDVLQEQRAILLGEPAGLAALDRLRPEYVWLPLPESRVTRDWLAASGYRVDVETARSFVAVRQDLPAIPASDGAAAPCFPGL